LRRPAPPQRHVHAHVATPALRPERPRVVRVRSVARRAHRPHRRHRRARRSTVTLAAYHPAVAARPVRASLAGPRIVDPRNGDETTAWLMILAGFSGLLIAYALRRAQLIRRG
jgi:hypothetical protein